MTKQEPPRSFHVESAEIAAPMEIAFDYIADVQNLPAWTHAFKQVRDGSAVMQTPSGTIEVKLEVKASEECGTIDWFMTMPDGVTRSLQWPCIAPILNTAHPPISLLPSRPSFSNHTTPERGWLRSPFSHPPPPPWPGRVGLAHRQSDPDVAHLSIPAESMCKRGMNP